jgi:hypothetical protein
MTGLQAATTGTLTSAIAGVTYSSAQGWGYDGNVFRAGMGSMWISSLTSMTSTFTTSSLTAINSGVLLSNGQDWSKLDGFNRTQQAGVQTANSLIGSLASQGMNYAFGGNFTLNVFNLSMFRQEGIHGGILELHFGRDGASMNFGTGGANVSFDNLQAAFTGLQAWGVSSQVNRYGRQNELSVEDLVFLRAQYGYGDRTQVGQLRDILRGNVLLDTGADGDYRAMTTLGGDGRRVISLTGYQQGMSAEQQFLLAVILGHEAHRDGVVTADNYLETRTATLAHTQMAMRMMFGGEDINDANLLRDIAELMTAQALGDMSSFFAYIDANYDSSADYWRLVTDGNRILGFEWDNSLDFDLTALGEETLSELGLEGIIASLDEDTLRAIWNWSNNPESLCNFRNAVETFGILNREVRSLQELLSDDPDFKRSVSEEVIRDQIGYFFAALRGVDSSGLLLRTDSVFATPGAGRHIFADGGGMITSFFGGRVNSIDGTNFFLEDHNGLDLVATGNPRLVAAMAGSLNLNFNRESGLNITIAEAANHYLSYNHADAASILNIISLFSSIGIKVNNDSLGGIAQNMIIGTMGNTGTNSTGAHAHIEYWMNGIAQDPLLFLNRTFPSNTFANLMSGFTGTVCTFQPSPWEVYGISHFLSTDPRYRGNYPNNFFNIRHNNNQINQNLFHSIFTSPHRSSF